MHNLKDLHLRDAQPEESPVPQCHTDFEYEAEVILIVFESCGKRFYAEFLESIDRINKRESELGREGKNTPPPCPNVNVDESVCRGKTISRESPSQPGVSVPTGGFQH